MLEKIQSLEDVKKLKFLEVQELCQDIRNEIIKTISINGGHLASNLGVVELTVSYHRIFNSPDDILIFDVGHQCYAHKILTGRYKEFNNIRKIDGISGFPKRTESVHDHFDTGHSSTSISAAIGYALSRDLRGENHEVTALIGDGSLTGGMALEALNHGGHLGCNFNIILNDNEMSISENVGALSKHLVKISYGKSYRRFKSVTTDVLVKTKVGRFIRRTLSKVKGSAKYLFSKRGLWFNSLGYTYLGPIDGHDSINLEESFKMAKNIPGPVIIHIHTTKGKGHTLAETEPEKYHGISNSQKSDKIQFTNVFSEEICALGHLDERIVCITAAMPSGTGLNFFKEQFPKRFFDVSIAEQHGITCSAALGLDNHIPFVAIYSTFMQRAVDQVIHDVLLQKSNVKMILDRAGLVAEDGETHHGVFDIVLFGNLPDLVFMEPSSKNELIEFLRFAKDYVGPVMIRMPKDKFTDRNFNDAPIVLGEGILHKIPEEKQGTMKILIAALGLEINLGEEIRNALREIHGDITVDLFSPRFISPISQKTIDLYESYDLVCTLENGVSRGGYGTKVKDYTKNVEVVSFGYDYGFIKHGKNEELRERSTFNKESIIKEIKEIINGKI